MSTYSIRPDSGNECVWIPSGKSAPWQVLPEDPLCLILDHLTTQQLKEISSVCQAWHRSRAFQVVRDARDGYPIALSQAFFDHSRWLSTLPVVRKVYGVDDVQQKMPDHSALARVVFPSPPGFPVSSTSTGVAFHVQGRANQSYKRADGSEGPLSELNGIIVIQRNADFVPMWFREENTVSAYLQRKTSTSLSGGGFLYRFAISSNFRKEVDDCYTDYYLRTDPDGDWPVIEHRSPFRAQSMAWVFPILRGTDPLFELTVARPSPPVAPPPVIADVIASVDDNMPALELSHDAASPPPTPTGLRWVAAQITRFFSALCEMLAALGRAIQACIRRQH